MPKNLAPITFLLGTSTAGKSSICNKILEQSAGNPDLQGKVKIWGHDQESEVLFEKLGLDMFQDDARLTQITERLSNHQISKKNSNEYEVLTAVWGGSFKDHESGKSLPLDEEGFSESISKFLEDAGNRYDVQSMNLIKEMAQEEIQTGDYKKATTALFHEPEKITRSAIDRAIENSKNGIATILDGVPLGFMREDNPNHDYRIVEQMDEYLSHKEFNGPTQVALVHLHPKEMASRMEQRNINARSEGGDKWDERDGLGFYEAQYGQLFGKVSNDGSLLSPAQEISRKDIYNIAEKFGDAKVDGKNVKIRDLKKEALSGRFNSEEGNEAQNISTLAIRSEGKRMLDAIGFEDGEHSVRIGTKVRADVVFDHQSQSTSEISSQIVSFICQNMEAAQVFQDSNSLDKDLDSKPKAKEAEDIIPSGRSWVERISNFRRAKDDSEILR
jgi:hypothetical protein